jgi:hypothetical protein
VLTGDPWRLSIDEIKRLTPYQVRNIYLRERNEDGTLKLERDSGLTYEQQFRVYMRSAGHPEDEIERLWQRKLAELANGNATKSA